MSFHRGAFYSLSLFCIASVKYGVQSWSEHRTSWHRQRPRDRIQFGEAAVPVEQVECLLGRRLELSLSSRERNFSQWCQQQHLGHARSKARKHLDQFLKKNRTRFTTLFKIVLLGLLSIVVRIAPITAPRHAKVSCWNNCFVVLRAHVCMWKLTSLGRLRLCEGQVSENSVTVSTQNVLNVVPR